MHCLLFSSPPSPLSLLLSFLDVMHCLPRAVGVPLESALNLFTLTGSCRARATRFAVLGVKIICSIFEMIELMIRVFMEVRITYLSKHNQLVLLCLCRLPHLLLFVNHKVSLSHPLPAYPLLGWVVRESIQKRVLDRKNRKMEK